MAYNATYAAADMDDIAVDGIGTFGVALIGFATLVGLVLVWRYVKRGKFF